MLVAIANVVSVARHRGNPVLSVSLQPVTGFAGLRKDARPSSGSLDIAFQGMQPIVLIHGIRPIALPFHRDKTISFTGWAVDGTSPAGGVYLVIDGSKRFPAAYGFDRPDVANGLHAPATRQVGFQVDVAPNVLRRGAHKLSLQVIDKTGQAFYAAVPQATIALGN